ncbi:YjfB family protein [Oceanospirillum sediminis]|uniref:YjfB family protein n=1 Tax=Oceanospirillum sediminis TaxID=2760088 RepID=A0A839IQA1_9GAMM|nr:YjfB family protein [Oceanospirillum sediminis]MBB1486702.1 YjfB family protein [Oceanospirillum sediminis]
MDAIGNIAMSMGQSNAMLGVQAALVKSIQDTQKSTVETLLGSVAQVQPSVEPHLGNNINVTA